jgi:hypothetical protein
MAALNAAFAPAGYRRSMVRYRRGVLSGQV